jgi:hypothetical protein
MLIGPIMLLIIVPALRLLLAGKSDAVSQARGPTEASP